MPKVSQQRPPVHRSNSSVLSEAMSVQDASFNYIKLLLYGQNRTGKTTLACQFYKPLLLISFEPAKSGGARSVMKVPGVDFIQLDSTLKARQLAAELANDKKYKTHVIDSVTSLQDVVLKEILGLDEVLAINEWGKASIHQYRERSEVTREILRAFLWLDCHTVCCAKEKDHNPPKEEESNTGLILESFIAADLGTATMNWLCDSCDYIGRLYLEKEVLVEKKTIKIGGKESVLEERRETGRIVRRLRTLQHPNYSAGFRTERPENVPEYIEDPTAEKILKLIEGR